MDEHRETPPYPRKGQHVRVLTGPFAGFGGTVINVDEDMRRAWVAVRFFGREVTVRLDVLQIEAAI